MPKLSQTFIDPFSVFVICQLSNRVLYGDVSVNRLSSRSFDERVLVTSQQLILRISIYALVDETSNTRRNMYSFSISSKIITLISIMCTFLK